jgi:hypothetical protein
MILRGHGGCAALVVPRHPLCRVHGQMRTMPEQLCQVLEYSRLCASRQTIRVDLVQFAGVDQTHEEIAHPCPVQRLIEERILTMQNSFLQCSCDDVVVERGALLTQEEGQSRPVFQ